MNFSYGSGRDAIDGALSTARVPRADTIAEERRRAERDAAAVRYLLASDNEDIIEILGLGDDQPRSGRCDAPGCGKPILPTATGGKQRFCNKSCAAIGAAAIRRANTQERRATRRG